MLSCAFMLFTAQKCSKNKYDYTPETSIEMSKTGCFGQCPVYTFKLSGDGMASYNGRRFVELEGEHSRQYAADTTNAVFKQLVEMDLFQYQNEYTDNVTDLPTTYIVFTHEGRTKKMKLYYGFPEELDQMMTQLQEVAFAKGWDGEMVKE